uniref:Uncharacterized protein n=1 Tax=Romanomermis culicivorax TaxID=13658 RepID=A0A915ISH8_ROMCU
MPFPSHIDGLRYSATLLARPGNNKTDQELGPLSTDRNGVEETLNDDLKEEEAEDQVQTRMKQKIKYKFVILCIDRIRWKHIRMRSSGHDLN